MFSKRATARHVGKGGGNSLGDIVAPGGGIGRKEPEPPRPVSLPSVSIVSGDWKLSNTDYRAGLAALEELERTTPAQAGALSGR